MNLRVKPCEHCEKPFDPGQHWKKARFCSRPCASRATSPHRKKSTNPPKRMELPMRKCEHCGVPFQTTVKHWKTARILFAHVW
jgi:hypothetical protein